MADTSAGQYDDTHCMGKKSVYRAISLVSFLCLLLNFCAKCDILLKKTWNYSITCYLKNKVKVSNDTLTIFLRE